MKKGLILIGLLALTLPTVQAQEPDTYFDTSFVHYWQFDWDAWVAQGSGNRVKYFKNLSYPFTQQGSEGIVGDVVQYYYTNDPNGIEIWGLVLFGWVDNPNSTLNPPEYLLLYDARPDTFELKAKVSWNPLDPHNSADYDMYYGTPSTPCPNTQHLHRENFYWEYYFDQPMVLHDSFYVGATHRIGMEIIMLGDTARPYWEELGLTGETINHGYPLVVTAFDTGSACTPPPFRWKIFNWNRGDRPEFPRFTWTPTYSDEYIMVLPIVRKITEVELPACTNVEDFRISGRMGAVTEFKWVSDGLHNEWELSYGIEGTPPDSGTVLSLTEPRYWLNDAAYPDTPMVAYIRTVCRERDILRHGQWSAGLHWDGHLVHQGIPAEGIGAYVELLPNPAQGVAVVSSSYRLSRICAYNMQGQAVLDRKVPLTQSEALDLSAWPKGVYLLRIDTLAGTVSKKLLVE